MSDSDFVDVGDELVVSISGFPVGRAKITKVTSEDVFVEFMGRTLYLPLNFKDWDRVDGVNHHVGDVEYGHGSQPLSGQASKDAQPLTGVGDIDL